MHHADLSLCRYHNGPYDADQWQCPLQAIGWLESPHAFPTGRPPAGLVARLEAFIEASAKYYPSQAFRGRHACTLCQAGFPRGHHLARSEVNIWVPGEGVIYIAPGTINHYVGDHGYLPPDSFVRAVMNCPDYATAAYCTALREANGGTPIPLLTEAEVQAEWEAEREKWKARRNEGQPES